MLAGGTVVIAAHAHTPRTLLEADGVDQNWESTAAASSWNENPYLFPPQLLEFAARSGSSDVGIPTVSQSITDNSDVRAWWLVHSKPRQEKVLADELQKWNVPHYLPVTKFKAYTRGKLRLTRAPQFPGYLFLFGNAIERVRALKTNRIVAVHAVDDQGRLSRQLLELADLIEKGVPLRIEERLVAGQNVRVKAGLLRNKQGVIMKRGGKTRLFVFVNELLGGVSVEIDQSLLEPY